MNKHSLIIGVALSLIVSILLIIFLPWHQIQPTERPFGVWWWDDELDATYLDFAEQQGINEIYYCSSKFNEETEDFIRSAQHKGIYVYWLGGDASWISNYDQLKTKIDSYLNYQHSHKYRFKGIHLDIEPRQHSDYGTNSHLIIQQFVELCYIVSQDYPNLYVEYDLPFWLDEEVELNSQVKPAYQFFIDLASRVTIMSYRDTSEAIYSVARDEVEYALSVGKRINLSVETKSKEGDHVSFMEEGKTIMMTEIAKVQELIPTNCGIVIHQIYDWYHLAD